MALKIKPPTEPEPVPQAINICVEGQVIAVKIFEQRINAVRVRKEDGTELTFTPSDFAAAYQLANPTGEKLP